MTLVTVHLHRSIEIVTAPSLLVRSDAALDKTVRRATELSARRRGSVRPRVARWPATSVQPNYLRVEADRAGRGTGVAILLPGRSLFGAASTLTAGFGQRHINDMAQLTALIVSHDDEFKRQAAHAAAGVRRSRRNRRRPRDRRRVRIPTSRSSTSAPMRPRAWRRSSGSARRTRRWRSSRSPWRPNRI